LCKIATYNCLLFCQNLNTKLLYCKVGKSMNKRSLSSLTLLVMTTLLLSGCWDVTEPQRMYYINAIGIDFKDSQYEVYMQILNLDAVAKSEQPNPDVIPSEVGFAKGRTVEEAIYKLYRSSDQQIFWGHMRYLIFSENA